MNQTQVIVASAALCLIGIGILETQRRSPLPVAAKPITTSPARLVGEFIRAPGRTTGSTEEVRLHAQIIEPIREIHVQQGDVVRQGDRLITLDQQSLLHQADLARAELERNRAELLRLQNGNRASEIAALQTRLHAAESRLAAAKSRFARAEKLLAANAISHQEFENFQFDFQTLSSLADVARNELETIAQPARVEDISVAQASISASEARLKLVQHQLSQTIITAPSDGTILKVNARLGELPRTTVAGPLLIMCNMSQQRVILEVDEYDALRITLGQQCELTADGLDGVLARGSITEIEPRMAPKETFGEWAGERRDTFTRRAWVDLEESSQPLPLGLPVRAHILIAQ